MTWVPRVFSLLFHNSNENAVSPHFGWTPSPCTFHYRVGKLIGGDVDLTPQTSDWDFVPFISWPMTNNVQLVDSILDRFSSVFITCDTRRKYEDISLWKPEQQSVESVFLVSEYLRVFGHKVPRIQRWKLPQPMLTKWFLCYQALFFKFETWGW